MAGLPQYNEAQVAEKALPGVQQNSVATPALLAGAFDSATKASQGLSDAGATANAIADKFIERANVKAVFDAETSLKSKYLDYDANVKKNERGSFAEGATNRMKDWWEEQGKEHAKALKNDTQRQLFINRMQGLRLQAMTHANAFEREQTDLAQEQSYKANKVAEINVAATLGTDAALDAAKTNIRKMNADRAAAKGWASDFLKGVNDEDITRLHDQTIERMVAGNRGDEAKAYFDKYKTEITSSETRTKLEKMSEHANAAIVSVRSAGDIVAKVGMTGGLDVMEEEARKQFEKQPETLKMVIGNLRERVAAFKEGERTRVSASQAPLTLAVMNGISPDALRRDPRFAQLAAMGEAGAEKAAALIQHAQRTAEHGASMANAAESRAYTAELRAQVRLNTKGLDAAMRLSDPTVLAGMQRNDVINLAPTLGNENTQHLLNKWDVITKGGSHLQEAKLDNDAFKSFLERMKVPAFPKDEAGKQMIVDIQNKVERMIISEQEAQKRVLKRSEKDAIMERELKNMVTTKSFGIFNSQEYAIKLNDFTGASVNVGGKSIPVSSIPPSDMQRITRQIQQEGKHPPTLENIAKVWAADKAKSKPITGQ